MGQFRCFVKELHLSGCLFTWSNERAHPTLERIDRAFILQGVGQALPKQRFAVFGFDLL
jgi:hypothetical protein